MCSTRECCRDQHSLRGLDRFIINNYYCTPGSIIFLQTITQTCHYSRCHACVRDSIILDTEIKAYAERTAMGGDGPSYLQSKRREYVRELNKAKKMGTNCYIAMPMVGQSTQNRLFTRQKRRNTHGRALRMRKLTGQNKMSLLRLLLGQISKTVHPIPSSLHLAAHMCLCLCVFLSLQIMVCHQPLSRYHCFLCQTGLAQSMQTVLVHHRCTNLLRREFLMFQYCLLSLDVEINFSLGQKQTVFLMCCWQGAIIKFCTRGH